MIHRSAKKTSSPKQRGIPHPQATIMSNDSNDIRSGKSRGHSKIRGPLINRLSKPSDASPAGETPGGGLACNAIGVVREISRTTTKEHIVDILVQNGCSNVTGQLKDGRFTAVAVACGGLGDVYKGTIPWSRVVAVKCARAHAIERDTDYMQNTAHEIYVWSKCKHENVLELLGMGLFRDQLVAVSPWMENGNARDYLKQQPEVDRCQLCTQITIGVEYLHKCGIVHGDIKGANVLISETGVAKISDFGNACLKEYAIKFDRLPRYTQSERWSAYEICREEGAYSRETDVYALAMTILEIITGQDPHVQSKTNVHVLYAVGVENRIPARPVMLIPTESKDGNTLWSTLERCWSVDPKRRPNASDVKAMLTSIDKDGLKDESTPTSRTSMIFAGLLQYGCPNVTDKLERDRCEEVAVTAEEPLTWYKGALTDNTQVLLQPIKIPSFSVLDPQKNHREVQSTARDLFLWSKCNHVNVAPMLGIALLGDRIVVVMPWMATTDLLTFLLRHHRLDRCKMGASLARGLAYLHSSNLFHCSSHSSSIKVSGEGIIKIVPQVGIGTSIHYQCPMCEGKCGAPDESTEIATSRYKEENDIYGLGMILLEMITGRRRTCSVKNIFRDGQFPSRPGCLPTHTKYGDAVWTLLTTCWDPEPRTRPTAAAIAMKLEGMNDAELYGLSKSGVPLLPLYIHSQMTVHEIMVIFAENGISDLTGQLTHGGTAAMENTLKLAGGLNNVVYQGSIARGSLRVAVAMRRRPLFSTIDAFVPLSMLQSIYAWSKCSHPNILPLLGLASHNGSLATISPWMEEGDLVGYIERTRDANRCSLATQTADAVTYLHEMGIIHGNLKGSSIQVSDAGVVKLGGFGSASFSHTSSRWHSEPIIFETNSDYSQSQGMLRWMAPELFEDNLSVPSFASDVYALGMTILECISGSVPFPEVKNEIMLMRLLLVNQIEPNRPTGQIPYTSAQGDTLWSLLCRCWEYNSTERPSAAEVRDVMATITPEGLLRPWELMILGAESML